MMAGEVAVGVAVSVATLPAAGASAVWAVLSEPATAIATVPAVLAPSVGGGQPGELAWSKAFATLSEDLHRPAFNAAAALSALKPLSVHASLTWDSEKPSPTN